MSDIVEQYVATWNAEGPERDRLLAAHWSPDVTYVDPLAEVRGHAALSGLIDGVRAQFPGGVLTRLSAVDAHHRQLRFSWGLGPAGQEPVVIGFDVVVLDEDGRIEDVRGFLDRVPA
ncbi:nuclear transport factor 2 family protein [Nocardioides pantholopis]|uniref:nuclear transport factor 2 family protein n=1 Tax=Nocardioides pantholopis TaxID=2483798 RepID=UPI000F088123|nr:nuclear transport factor 2 family protein [Nocardioides pantholopis]